METVDYFVASCVLYDRLREVGSFLTRGVRARRSQRSAALSFGYVKASCYSKSFRGSTTVLLIAVAPRSVTSGGR